MLPSARLHPLHKRPRISPVTAFSTWVFRKFWMAETLECGGSTPLWPCLGQHVHCGNRGKRRRAAAPQRLRLTLNTQTENAISDNGQREILFQSEPQSKWHNVHSMR